MLRCVCLAIAALCLVFSTPAGAQAPIPFNIHLSLEDPESGQPRYEGLQRVRETRGVVSTDTEYRDLQGAVLQTVNIRFDKATLTPIRYERQDPGTGMLERYTLDGNTLTLVTRKAAGEREQKETLEWIAGWISTVGVPSYIRRNWLELEAGEKLEFPLFVSGRKTAYTFVVRRDESTERSGEGLLVMRMDADSFVVRQFVDTLWFVFKSQPPYQLLVFEGRSSLPNASGDALRLRMTFDYENFSTADSAARGESTGAAATGAVPQ